MRYHPSILASVLLTAAAPEGNGPAATPDPAAGSSRAATPPAPAPAGSSQLATPPAPAGAPAPAEPSGAGPGLNPDAARSAHVPSVSERLRALFSPKVAAGQITAATAVAAGDLIAVNRKLDQDLTAARAEIAALRPKAEEHDRLLGVIQQLEGERRTLGAATAETVAGLGFNLADLPAADAAAPEAADLAKQWNNLSGAAKTEFFRQNRAALTEYAAKHGGGKN